MTTAMILTLLMYAASFYLTLMGCKGALVMMANVRERRRFERALRRAGL
jgi:hypothetical protein